MTAPRHCCLTSHALDCPPLLPAQNYRLVEDKELAPLQELIDQFTGRAGQQQQQQ